MLARAGLRFADVELGAAIRFVLFEVWSALGERRYTEEMAPLLSHTHAGHVLEAMRQHHRSRQNRGKSQATTV